MMLEKCYSFNCAHLTVLLLGVLLQSWLCKAQVLFFLSKVCSYASGLRTVLPLHPPFSCKEKTRVLFYLFLTSVTKQQCSASVMSQERGVS